MIEESKKMFDTIISKLLVPIIVKDKDIVNFMDDNEITDDNQIMNIVCWLAASTLMIAYKDSRDDEVADGVYNLAVKFKKSCADSLSEDFDDIDDILSEILSDNVEEWGEEISKKLTELQKYQEPKKGNKKLILRKSNSPKKADNEETDEPLPPEILNNFIDMQIKAYMEALGKNKYFLTLAKKYPKIPKKDLAEYVGCIMLGLVLSYSKSENFKGMEAIAGFFGQINKNVLLRTAKIMKKIDKLIGSKIKQLEKDVSSFIDKHSKEVMDQHGKIMARMQDELEGK